ncbi:hypothetical protein BJ741DRAFT_75425 [Chytriomyces cf. hyalinus JEL632]|nr:hypothetical protein BJ741DRAFT_75425 [Chytriomyces cf. hyalinus JEL632]
MDSNLGTLQYGDMNILSGFDTASAGGGRLFVQGSALLAGSSTTISGSASLNDTLAVTGSSLFNASVSITDTSASSSFTSGALTVAGGLGLFVKSGSWTSIAGTDATLSASADTIRLRNSSSSESGQFESTLTMFNFTTASASPFVTLTIDKSTGYVLVKQTDDASSTTSGALQVAGGASIAKKLYVGSDASVGGTLSVHGDLLLTGALTTTGTDPVVFSNTTDSTSPSTGSVVINGGIGIAKSLFIAGPQVITNVTDSTGLGTGSFVTSGGASIAGATFIGGASTVSGQLTVLDTADATSPSTGSAVLSGGLGVAKAVYIGSTINSTSSSSGALVVDGGLGLAKDAFFQGSLQFTSAASVLQFNNTTDTSASSLSAPTFSVRSVGTRMVLNPALSISSVDYGLGVDAGFFRLTSSSRKRCGRVSRSCVFAFPLLVPCFYSKKGIMQSVVPSLESQSVLN